MSLKNIFAAALILSGASAANVAIAESITLKLSGNIISVAPELDAIETGSTFDLYYTFDSSAIDSNTSETRGDYELYSIALNINTYHAETAHGAGNGGFITVDNSGDTGIDQYNINSSTPYGFYALTAPFIGDRKLIAIGVQFIDNNASVFNSDSLPLTPFNLNQFESAQLDLLFSNNWQHNVAFDAKRVYGNITSITAVPVPASAWLFSSCLIACVGGARRKAK